MRCCIYLSLRVFLDLSILISYIRGIFAFNYHLCRIDSIKNNVDSMQHEQLLIITRYFVIFIISVLMDISMALTITI